MSFASSAIPGCMPWQGWESCSTRLCQPPAGWQMSSESRMRRRARWAKLRNKAARGGDQTVGLLHGATGTSWALRNGQAIRSRGEALGLEVGVGNEARPSKETVDCWERGTFPLHPTGFQSCQEPVPFFLGPGEALYGSRKVLFESNPRQRILKQDPGTQVSPAAFGITKKQSWGSQD